MGRKNIANGRKHLTGEVVRDKYAKPEAGGSSASSREARVFHVKNCVTYDHESVATWRGLPEFMTFWIISDFQQ